MSLPEAKARLVAQVLAAAPADVLKRLEMVLHRAMAVEAVFAPVHALAVAETYRRELMSEIFKPILPMAEKRDAPRITLIARSKLAEAWRAVVEADPRLVDAVAYALKTRRRGEPPPSILDEVCQRAAELKRGDAQIARLLRVTPVLRRVQENLAIWTSHLSDQSIASVRVAFDDALEITEGDGPLFWEAVFAMLEEPWRIVRLISAVTDRPSDRFLAGSEMAELCERLLEDVDRRITALRRFDPERGDLLAAEEAASVHVAVQIMAEFEEWIALSRSGPWGERIAQQRTALALAMESWLKDIEDAVSKALPMEPNRGGAKAARFAPKLDSEPSPYLVNRAQSLLVLMETSRAAAAGGGFAALRSKIVKNLEQRLSQYCSSIIDIQRQDGAIDRERNQAFFEIAARFLEQISNAQNTQSLRRRMAAS